MIKSKNKIKIKKRFTLPIGELFDRLSIANIKVWQAEVAISKANNNDEIAELALMVRRWNSERSEIREEINERWEGKKFGTIKINYGKLGRDK